MSDDFALRAVDLSKRFTLQRERRSSFKERAVRGKGGNTGDFWALRNVSFDVPKGGFFGVVGHNGSGKSTVLKILAGIYRPTSGHIEVNGRLRALLELGAGFHPELTGRENIQLNASILGMSQKQIRSSVDEIIEFAEIGDFIDSPVKVYSSGMSVRLGFAVAVKMDPEILIVDEVIAVGDESFQRRCHDYMFDLRNRGATIVLVTHSMAAIEGMCDEAVWLDHGEVQLQSTPAEVVRAYLQQVNRAEAEQAFGSGHQLGTEAARSGSGGIRIERLEIVGAAESFVTSGQLARLRLHYSADEDLPACHVGVTFHHESGVTVSHCVTWDDGPFAVPRGSGHFDIVMEPVLLEPASYLLSTTLAVRGHVFDRMDRAFTLVVRGSGADPEGLVSLPVAWSFQPEMP